MVATHYVWDPEFDCITKETNDVGAVTARYTQEPKRYGGLISQHRSGATSIYHFDAIGTTRALTDNNQAVTDTAVCTAFGEKVLSVGTTVNPFGFIGQLGYSGSAYGWSYVRARTYGVTLGRWMSRDDLHYAPVAVYRYVINSPCILVDPTGNQAATAACTSGIATCLKTGYSKHLLREMRYKVRLAANQCRMIELRIDELVRFWEERTEREITRIGLKEFQDKLDALNDQLKLCLTRSKAVAKRCAEPSFDCVNCGVLNIASIIPWGTPTLTPGFINPGEGTITICSDVCTTAPQVTRTCLHELTHAYDYCMGAALDRGNTSRNRCRDIACSELRAYSATDQCTLVLANKGLEAWRQCIIEAAEESVEEAGCPTGLVAKLADKCILENGFGPPYSVPAPWPFSES